MVLGLVLANADEPLAAVHGLSGAVSGALPADLEVRDDGYVARATTSQDGAGRRRDPGADLSKPAAWRRAVEGLVRAALRLRRAQT
ncbi:MAG: hypothetical protein KAI24_07250 [Planctomycetes bacterium]|nr:hypothetical protein [Planctomycetota bacterium]